MREEMQELCSHRSNPTLSPFFLHVSQYLNMEMGKGILIFRIEFVIATKNIHNQVYKKNQQGHLNLNVASSNVM